MKSMARLLPLFVLLAAFTASCGGKNDGPVCGNDSCEAGEDANSCSEDCAASCGNGTCDSNESATTCSADCSAACNNNGTCNVGEDTANCPADCPAACNNDGTCDAGEDATSCPNDCASTCGNGTCDTGETTANCSADCPAASCNNNGTCDAGETTASCLADCPAAACNVNGVCDAGETSATCPADCTTANICALVAGGSNTGTECSTEAEGFCGTGVCASFDAANPATCFQACVPTDCETTCTGTERCLGVTDANGAALEVQPGIPLGVCDTPATGAQAAFDECGGAAGACVTAMDCLAFSAGGTAMCMPQCVADADCPAKDSIASTCVITTSAGAAPSNCGIICDPATPNCPTGMTCTAVTGGGLCMLP